MDAYFLIKTLHIISSTILFGFGAGTAWYMWNAHRSRDAATIAAIGKMVVRADWIFTGTSGVVQPVSGLWLAHAAGYSFTEPWLLLTYGLYLTALACWIPVVRLQIMAQRLAATASRKNERLGADYDRTMRLWFALGWPAFFALVGVFWLMVTKPAVW